MTDRHIWSLFQDQWHPFHPYDAPLFILSHLNTSGFIHILTLPHLLPKRFLTYVFISYTMQVFQAVTTSMLTMSMATAVKMPTLPLRDPSLRLLGISGGWSGSSTQPTLS